MNIKSVGSPEDCPDWMKRFKPTDLKWLNTEKTAALCVASDNRYRLRIIWTKDGSVQKTGFTDIPTPFSALVQWDVSPDGTVVIGYPDSYTIDIYSGGKGKIRSFSHTSKPVKVTENDKKTFIDSLRYTITMGGNTRVVEPPEWMLEYIEFPKNKPSFSSVFFDAEGNILVGIEKKESSESTTFFDVFSPEGTFIKNIQMTGEKSIKASNNVFLLRMDSG